MAKNISVGIDVGTYQVKVVVAENTHPGERAVYKKLGTGCAESKGLRHGYIINHGDAVKSVRLAVAAAERSSGARIKSAYLSVGGIGLESAVSEATVVVGRADYEITDLELKEVQEACEAALPQSAVMNRKILHAIPVKYKIDDKEIYASRPVGMKGARLGAKTLFITCFEQHLSDLIQAVLDAGVDVIDAIASPVAASFVTLSKTQKIAGCVLANIGAETVSIIVYENNIPISMEVFPIGSTDITNDIALGFKIPLEEAEEIKLGTFTSTSYPKKKLEEIISARLSDIFELIEAHLKKIGRNGLLPAGIIISGGGSSLMSVEELARNSLKLPSKTAVINFKNEGGSFVDSTWAVAYGLAVLGFASEEDGEFIGIKIVKGAGANFLSWLKQFLP